MRKNLSIGLLLSLVLLWGTAVFASYYSSQRDDNYPYPGTQQASIVSTRVALTGSNQTITFSPPASCISFLPESDDVYVNWSNSGAATSSNAKIPKGMSYTYQGPPIKGIQYLGATSTGSVDIVAY